MSKQIDFAFNILGGAATVLVLFFVVTSLISNFQNNPTASNGTPTEIPAPSPTKESLLAFTAPGENENLEIYTIYPDGSNLTNLTNNPAQDHNPYWSPDGKRIAFLSNRNDPAGLPQIFVMNANGSDVTQLTDNEANHEFNVSNGGPWSPDGTRLLFTEWLPGNETWILYTIGIDGQNKTPLTEVPGNYAYSSWSRDGTHIAFITLENNVTRIYSTDADGNNLTDVTRTLPADETLYPVSYSWSRDGQSIFFIASTWNYLLGGGGSENDKWMVYEANLDGNTLVTHTTTRSQIGGYWDGTYFLSGSALASSSPAFTWVQQKGAVTTFNPLKNCQNLLDSNTGGYTTGYSSYKQSANGNVVIGAYCPNGDKWLFWANSKGIVRPLMNSPIHVEGNTVNAMHLWAPPDFFWSPDDKYIAFHIFSQGKTDMYIVNVVEALKDPTIQPVHITIGNDALYFTPSWYPFVP